MSAIAKKPIASNHIQKTVGSRIFDVCNILLMLLLCFVTLYPMWYVLCASFTENSYLVAHPGAILWPHGFTAGSYGLAFSHPLLLSGYKNILIVLLVSLPINIILTLFCGYVTASRNLMFKPLIQFLIMFTMFFSGGMIPTYLQFKNLGLINNVWAVILYSGVSAYNIIILKNGFEQTPPELEEAARIDGANDLVIFLRVELPLQGALLATFTLFTAVGYWNEWFWSTLLINSGSKMTLQVVLKAIVAESAALEDVSTGEAGMDAFAQGIKMAAVMLTMVPIMCLYPFLQKYFVKGVLVGSVKM